MFEQPGGLLLTSPESWNQQPIWNWESRTRELLKNKQKTELEPSRVFFPGEIWYTGVIPCSSHNPHNLLQEQQQNSWVGCKFSSNLQIWKHRKQGRNSTFIFHRQEQRHSREKAAKRSYFPNSCFAFVFQKLWQELKDTDFQQQRNINNWGNTCRGSLYTPKKGAKNVVPLHVLVRSLHMVWYKQHAKNYHRIELCLLPSRVGLFL